MVSPSGSILTVIVGIAPSRENIEQRRLSAGTIAPVVIASVAAPVNRYAGHAASADTYSSTSFRWTVFDPPHREGMLVLSGVCWSVVGWKGGGCRRTRLDGRGSRGGRAGRK